MQWAYREQSYGEILHFSYNDSCTHGVIIVNPIASGVVWLLKEYSEARPASQTKGLGIILIQ